MPRLNRRHSLLVRWSAISGVATAVVCGAVLFASRSERLVIPAAGAHVEGLTSVLRTALGDSTTPIRFDDVTRQLGIAFRHFSAKRSSLIAEDMGSGLAWGDYDADGFPDLFLVNFAGPVLPGASDDREQGRSRLYHNIGGERFEDVTEQAGITFAGFGMGACWGDFDNDGDLDLYVTAYGENVLYENLGDRTFRDVAERTGTNDPRFSSGCTWGDYDRDGNLDLYVCNYVDFVFRDGDRSLADPQYAEQPYTLNPSAYNPVPNALFHNNGDGTFTDVAVAAGVDDPKGKSLSAAWIDMDNDGWPDLYVANDVSFNGVFRNRGDGTFEDIGASSLSADYRSAMGLAVSDFDDDGDLDLFITHWIAQENALYRNMLIGDRNPSTAGRLWFLDAADQFGLGQIGLDMVGWAAGFVDFDNDGRRDLWMVNGHTFERVQGGDRVLVPQSPFIFWNQAPKPFVDVAASSCPRLALPFVGRGGAEADFDRDGRIDLALSVHGGEPILLRNVSSPAGHWSRILLRQTGANTNAIGARAYLTTGSVTQMADVGSNPSYLSQGDLPLHFGMGPTNRVDRLRIVWPDGTEEIRTDLPVDVQLRFDHSPRYPVERTR